MHGHLQVPGFTIRRRLGSDASSNWLAVQDASGAPVTLRVVSGAAMTVRPRLLAAIDVLRELDHPHVLRYQDMIERADDVVIVLDAADGGSLSDLLRARGTLPPGEVVTACAPIAEGLAEMHQHGIVHGAVTGDDIMFAADGRPLLAGVGLGVLGVWPPAGAAAIAPETVVGVPAEPPADVYSLAYVTCVALSGYQPREPLSIVGVPGSTLGVLSRCLLRTPDHRPEVGVLANAVYGIAAPEPVDLVPDEVEATSSLPRIDAGMLGDATSATGVVPDVGTAEDVESFMRGGAGGRRGRRPAGRRGDAAGRREEPAAPGSAGTDPDSTVTRPIAAPGAGASYAGGAPAGRGDVGGGAAGGGLAGNAPASGRPATGGTPAGLGGHGSPAGPSFADRDGAGPDGAVADDAGRAGAGRGRHGGAGDDRGGNRGNGSSPGRTGSSGVEERRRPGGLDTVKVAIVIVVLLLVGVGVIFRDRIFGDDELPTPGTGGADQTVEPTDLCGGPQPAPSEAPPAVTDWVQEIQRLYELRTRAFAELDATLLCEVYAPTSESLARDVDLLQQYSEADLRPDGLAFEVIDVTLVAESGGTVTVEITDQITEYDLVEEDGDVNRTEPAVEALTWQADLVAAAGPDGGAPTWRFG